MRILLLSLVAAIPSWPQDALTVAQAVDTALAKHPAIEAGASGVKAAEAKIGEARGALLPRVSYNESWQRSNNEVFVFGSLLTQHQFTPANFDINFLNYPPFLNNFQSQIIVDQTVYDFGMRKSQIGTAQLGRDVALESNRKTEMDVIGSVLRAYYTAVVAQEQVRVAAEALRSAEADLQRAETRRGAGITTDADVLSMRVHVAAMRAQQIQRNSELELARAELNQAMGLPLDTRFNLSSPLKAATLAPTDEPQLEKDAVAERPEMRAAQLAMKVSDEQKKAARAALLPEFYMRGGFESDRQRFYDRAGANWLVAAGLKWTLFNGFSDRARLEAARHEIDQRAAQARLAESYVRLDARRAWLDLQSASQRIDVSKASAAMAEESLRIIRNRYESGLTEVTELLRGETALLEARTLELEAVRDQVLAAVALESARGKLTKNSELVTR